MPKRRKVSCSSEDEEDDALFSQFDSAAECQYSTSDESDTKKGKKKKKKKKKSKKSKKQRKSTKDIWIQIDENEDIVPYSFTLGKS